MTRSRVEATFGVLCFTSVVLFLAIRRRKTNRLRRFCRRLPKVELHAHLSGSIRPTTLLALSARHFGPDGEARARQTLGLSTGTTRETRALGECFAIFDLIHDAVRTREDLTLITKEVVTDFEDDNVKYLELRTTPRDLPDGTTRHEYVANIASILEEVNNSSRQISCRLLLSIDRATADDAVAHSTVALAHEFTPIVVGIDLSGNPTKGTFSSFLPALEAARESGLSVTLHCAEVANDDEVTQMINFQPDRLGHALTLNSEHRKHLLSMARPIPIEICPTSNIKTLQLSSLSLHPTARLWINYNYPFCINTDDSGVFATNSSTELFLFADAMGINEHKLTLISRAAAHFSFLPKGEKDQLVRKLSGECGFLLWLTWASFGAI